MQHETKVHTCPDCNSITHRESYLTWRNEPRITYTCKTQGCLLNSVTLTADEWLTANLESYRKINRAKRA